MPAAWGSGTSVRTTATATYTVNKPTGVNAGDILYLVAFMIRGGGSQTFNTPSGFTSKGTAQQTGQGYMQVWERIADGTEGSTFTVTATSGGTTGSLACLHITGSDITTPTNAVALATPTIASSITAPAVTTTVTNALVIRVFAESDGTAARTWTTATGYTEQQDADSIAVDTLTQSGTGSTGTVSATVSASGAVGAVTIAVAPSTGTLYTATYAVQATPILAQAKTALVTRKVTATPGLARGLAPAVTRLVQANIVVARTAPGQLFTKAFTAVANIVVSSVRSLLPSGPVPTLCTVNALPVTQVDVESMPVTTVTVEVSDAV